MKAMRSRTYYTKLIIGSIVKKSPLETDYIPKEIIDYAKSNKILYLLGLYDKRIQNYQEWQELRRRRKEQKKALVDVAYIAEKLGLEIMIVKTIKAFEYVPDDIDILIMDCRDMNYFIDELLKMGYFIRKKGTPEITLRKVTNNTFVDLDIHTKMAAGPYEYIDKHYLWKRRNRKKIDNVEVMVPNEIDELLITVAHAIMKELLVLLADVLQVLYQNNQILRNAKEQSKDVGISTAFNYMLKIASKIVTLYLDKGAESIEFPLKVPVPIILGTYMENLSLRMKQQGLKPLKELINVPSSKGIGILLRYVT